MVKDDVVPSLISLVETGDDKTMQYAANALHNLAKHKRSHARIIDENAVPCLIGLSKSTNSETRRRAALALCKLSGYKPSRERMVEVGTIPVIIELTRVRSSLCAFLRLYCSRSSPTCSLCPPLPPSV